MGAVRTVLLLASLLASLAVPAQEVLHQPEPAASRSATGATAVGRHFMAVTANPHATAAAAEMLGRGGTAADGAIAAQLVLGLVEPQSSGLGGGGFLLYLEGRTGRLHAWDGRETAPAAARPDLFLSRDGKPLGFHDGVIGGRSVGVPGIPRLMETVHRQHGRLPWKELFAPAIRLAEEGFPISPRLHALLAAEKHLPTQPAGRAHFYDGAGRPWPVGHVLRNPALARTLRSLAEEGADAFYQGKIGRDMVAAVRGHPSNPGSLSLADLAAYRVVDRQPVCGTYRGWKVCGMPPPSSGGSTVLALLGMLERFDLAQLRPDSAFATHLFAEAGRLAYADRDRYVADPAFVSVPLAGLVDRAYLAARSSLIRFGRSLGKAEAGLPPGTTALARGEDAALELPSTSHLSIVDREGNAVSFTSSVEDGFGSRQLVDGFLLNNQLTDFSFVPEQDGRPVANRVEAGKRPRSSMAPTLVFDPRGRLQWVLGSPGGSPIINYVAQTLVALIDWKMDPAAALAQPHAGSRNGPTELEKGTPAEAQGATLRALGHPVRITDMTSGISLIARTKTGWQGAADPRREGTAAGD